MIDKVKYILFDFDGVIVDSFQPAYEVSKIMCPAMTIEDYMKRFEGNINNWIEKEMKHDDKCRHDLNFFDLYIPRLNKEVKLFPGMAELISKLSDSYKLIIISSTVTAPIEDLLKKFDLLKYFTLVMGNDVHKSKVEKIKMVFEKFNTTKDDCVFITDTLGDIKEASHTGVRAIAVTWGFNKSEVLLRGNPYKIVDSVGELHDLLLNI